MTEKEYKKIEKSLNKLIQMVKKNSVRMKTQEYLRLKDKLFSASKILENNSCYFIEGSWFHFVL